MKQIQLQAISSQTFSYEIYTVGPNGEKGWDIKTGWAKAETLQHAKAKIAAHFSGIFDCFIQVYAANMNSDDILTID